MKMWHKLLLVATFVVFIDTGNAQSCTATNGKKCVFPFFHKGRRINGCTKFTVQDSDPAWCSTKTTKAGHHIKGNYGDCPSSCPTDKPDKQEQIRRSLVKESCKVRGGIEGVCVPSNKCLSVSSPKKGSCSSRSHVCCYYEKPSGSSDRQVNSALSQQSRLRESRRTTGYSSPLAAFNLPKYRAGKIDLAARRIQKAAEEIINALGFSSSGYQPLRHYSSQNNRELEKMCPWFFDEETGRKVVYECTDEDRPLYRPIDGSCNFLSRPHLGKSFTPFSRIMDADNGPGRSLRQSKSKGKLPSARLLSTKLSKTSPEEDGTSAFMTVFVMQMGQFIDHDLAHSPNHNDPDLKCCGKDKDHENCAPIDIPKNDPFFSKHGHDCMSMARAMTSPNIDCDMDNTGQQMNELTHWLDASNIYGSEEKEINLLRDKRDGLLKTSRQKNMLPKCNENKEMNEGLAEEGEGAELGGLETCHAGCPQGDPFSGGCPNFAAGDFRVNEHHGLVSMHTLWMREHNRVARELKKAHGRWDNDKLFNEARRIVIAEYQHIIYNEWLTIVLGNEYMDNFGIKVLDSGYSNAYFGEGATPEQFDPRVSNEFATAAFRFGHSLIPPNFKQFSTSNRREISNFDLRKAFFKPGDFREDKDFPGDKDLLSELLLGMATQRGENWDNIFAEDIVNHLMEGDEAGTVTKSIKERVKNESTGLDLVAINIQRGRDHGLPGYNALREECGLGRAKRFSDFGKEMVPENWKNLERYYDHVDDVDLFAGGFLEQSGKGGGILGPVFRCIIGDTFLRLRYGDRYFYDLDQDEHLFRLSELNQIRKASLARILCDNVDEINRIQPRAFVLPGGTNKEVSCGNIPKVDLSNFRGL